TRQIKVFIYNSQNATPDVTVLKTKAQAVGIPVVTVTETLAPAGATFQAWQVAQLQALQQALPKAAAYPLRPGGYHDGIYSRDGAENWRHRTQAASGIIAG